MNRELPDIQACFREGRGTIDQIAPSECRLPAAIRPADRPSVGFVGS